MVCVRLLFRLCTRVPGAHRPTIETGMLFIVRYIRLNMWYELLVRFGSIRRCMTTLCPTSLLLLSSLFLWCLTLCVTRVRFDIVMCGQLPTRESDRVSVVPVHPKLASYMLIKLLSVVMVSVCLQLSAPQMTGTISLCL